jgi:hypothetical protein
MDGYPVCVSGEQGRRRNGDRLGASQEDNVFPLRGLTKNAMYDVLENGRIVMHAYGRQLTGRGLPIHLKEEWSAAVIQIKMQR